MVERIIDVISYDPTEIEDVIHAQLLTGEVKKVLASAEKLDVWLSCHLADVMNALGLLGQAEEGEEADEEYACLPPDLVFTRAHILFQNRNGPTRLSRPPIRRISPFGSGPLANHGGLSVCLWRNRHTQGGSSVAQGPLGLSYLFSANRI